MTPVDQTVFGNKKGNCWAACIASILDLPISEVPNFCGEPEANENWMSDSDTWAQKHGYRVVEFNEPKQICIQDGTYLIATGKSPRGDFNHAVIITVDKNGWKLVHDPHPSHAGLDGPATVFSVLVRK